MADFLNCPRPPPTHLSSGRRAVRPSYGAALVARGLCGPLDNRALRAAARPGLRTYSRHSCKSLASRSKSARASTVVHSAAARALGPHGHAHSHTAHGTRSRRDVHMGSLRRGSNELRLCGAIHTAHVVRVGGGDYNDNYDDARSVVSCVSCGAVLCGARASWPVPGTCNAMLSPTDVDTLTCPATVARRSRSNRNEPCMSYDDDASASIIRLVACGARAVLVVPQPPSPTQSHRCGHALR